VNYESITSLEYQTTCALTTQAEWQKLMKGAKRANKKKINALVKKHLPELFNDLALQFRNPYNYLKTATHLIIVHSAVEHFIKFD